jgi:hypothetical protein
VCKIENYPPGNTIVVVPEKLQKFYEDTKIPSDLYPWQGKCKAWPIYDSKLIGL